MQVRRYTATNPAVAYTRHIATTPTATNYTWTSTNTRDGRYLAQKARALNYQTTEV